MARRDNVPLRNLLRKIEIDRVDFVTAGANGEADIVLFKSHKTARKGAPIMPTKPTPTTDADALSALQKMVDDAVAAATKTAEEAAKSAHDAFIADLAALAAAPEPTEPALDPEVKKMFDVEKAKREALEAEVAKMRENEMERVFKSRARELPMIGGEDEVAAVLKGIAAGDTTVYERAEALLATANERITAGDLTKEVGGAGRPSSDKSRLMDAAKALRDADPSLTIEQAVNKAVAEDKTLYAEYRKQFKVAAE